MFVHSFACLLIFPFLCFESFISSADQLPEEKLKRVRKRRKPVDFSYHKWAHLGVPMLISAGDDTKLFAYSAMEFSNFSPHDICPTPQRLPIQHVMHTAGNHTSLLLVQAPYWLDILSLQTKNGVVPDMGTGPSRTIATTNLLARIKSKASRKIICSTMCASGVFFAYSDHVNPRLFELKRHGVGKTLWSINKRQLPRKLPFAHSMIFSSDSSRLMIAGHDKRIYVSCLCLIRLHIDLFYSLWVVLLSLTPKNLWCVYMIHK